jgi:hypothetical protein
LIQKGLSWMDSPANNGAHGGFFGRDALLQQLVGSLLRGTTLIRSHILQGPAGRGKTRLIDEIVKVLEATYTPMMRICTLRSADLKGLTQAELFPWMVAQLWLAIRDVVPLPQGPLGQLGYDAEREAIIEAVRDDELAFERMRQLVADSNPPLMLVIVVDSLDELQELRLIEDSFVFPLIVTTSRVRVLAARRASESRQIWTNTSLRQTTREHDLLPFPSPTDDQSPARRQLIYLLQESDRTAHTVATSLAQIEEAVPGYAWGNPGANRQLAQHYIEHGTITPAHIEDCIHTLIRPNQPLSSAYAGWTSDVIFTCLRRLSEAYSDLHQPKSANILSRSGGVEERHRMAFHTHLISCGICPPGNGQTFQLHPDIAELFRAFITRSAL